MKKITIHKQRCPLEATATDGIKSGTIEIDDIEDFIHQCVEEFEDDMFEQIYLKKMCLKINEHIEINKIIFKERK